MAKYRLLRERIESCSEFAACQILLPPEANDEQLALIHHTDYIDRVSQGKLSDLEIRRIGFPWSQQMVTRSRRSVGASIAAGFSAVEDGIAVNLAGGTHHAFPDAGQGFCVFNDTLVAARVASASKPYLDGDVY